MRHTILVMLAAAMLTGGCGILPGSLPEIPRPTPQIDPSEHEVKGYEGMFAPRQRAWPWDDRRWFEAEVESTCNGYIYFVDEAKEIDSYVGYESAPYVSFSSDDPDVVFGAIGAFGQLIFSTDGGRHFVREVRGFPRTLEPEFIAVRQGHVYVGMPDYHQELEGYFTWNARSMQERGQKDKLVEQKLILLEGKLDKAAGRISNYMILLPKTHRFRYRQPTLADRAHMKHVDYIDILNLPHTEEARANDSCKSSMKLPPWQSMWTREDLVEFVDWYAATKQANPGWANDRREKMVEYLKKKYGRTK